MYCRFKSKVFGLLLHFFSRRLNDTQKYYSAFDRELLVAFSAVKDFQYFIERKPFILFYD